ncbi:MAG TPA: FHA domain-containing protein [Polyangiaceae bacterium]|nr:FHA domain-containing protein [Polyangiaceae bacterium]
MEPTEKVDPSSARVSAASQVSLLLTWGDRALAVALREEQSCVVGRADSAEIVIDDPSLSRAHARLSLQNGQVIVEDLSSTNGCLLNGVRTSCAAMHDRDSVKLGSTELRVCARTSLAEERPDVSHACFKSTLGCPRLAESGANPGFLGDKAGGCILPADVD